MGFGVSGEVVFDIFYNNFAVIGGFGFAIIYDYRWIVTGVCIVDNDRFRRGRWRIIDD